MPKVVDHDHFREELLERCFYIFSQKGYSNVSIREIARETGVSTGTLYHYFKNKENILEELSFYYPKKNFGEYRAMIEGVENVEDRLKIITEFWKEHIVEYQNVILLAIDYLRTKTPAKTGRIFHNFADFYLHALSDTLAIPIQGAAMLFTQLMGIALASLFTQNIIKPDEQISYLYEILQFFTEKNTPATDNALNALMTRLFDVS